MRFSRIIIATLLVGSIITPLAVGAADQGAAISQGFTSEDDLARGTLVSFTEEEKDSRSVVTAANTENVDRLAGVVGDSQLLELSDEGDNTQVVVSGQVLALVSDINGDVKTGDRITASPLNGVGMRARSNTEIVGVAQADWSSAHNVQQRTVRQNDGSSKTIKVGLLPVHVGVTFYQVTKSDTVVPLFLQRTADEIAGRSVGPLRILISGLAFILGIGAAAIVLYSSISGSIIAIGRNPLSSPTIWRSLLEAGAIGVIIVLTTFIVVYLVLVA